jgi:hypothetical protein
VVRFSSACFAVAVLVCAQVVSYGAVPPTEDLLPNTTKCYLSVANVERLTEAFDKTQLGQLANDPTMKPFVEDLKRQLREKWTQTHQKLGITWEDLEGVPSGEVAIAFMLPSESQHALAILADVTGHEGQVDALLKKINENMAAEQAVRSEQRVLDATVVVFDIPKREELPPRQVVFCVKDNLFAATDNLMVMQGIVRRLGQSGTDSLSSLGAFKGIKKRCEEAAGDLKPHARWFIEPFGYADAVRLDRPKKRGTDILKILKTEGFTAIEGIGGFVNFSVGGYEMLHRTFIYAPGNQSGGERFTLSARMLKLPNGDNLLPPRWVPRDLATYVAINLDTKNAFENSKTLVNQIVGDEVFEDVLESIKTDENGPKIDIRRDLIGYLGNRITFISDLQLPVTPKSERLLVAVETTDDKHIAAVIKNWMETDPDTRRREIAGHVVWEIVDKEAELPMVTIENSPLDGDLPNEKPEKEEERALPPNSAVTVAYGQLFVASHIDILTKVLTEYENGPKLAGSADYLRVEAEIGKLAQPEQFGLAFTRTDEAYRGVYELLRAGKMPESESMVGKLFNALLGDGKEGVLRPQRIDGSKLPEYDMVRRYLGPAGMTMTTEATGWLLTGFTLTKEAKGPASSSDDGSPAKPAKPAEDTVRTGDVTP